MNEDWDESEVAESQGLLLVLSNVIQILAATHPDPQALRALLERANEQQHEAFEAGGAESALIEAYDYHSALLLKAIPDEA